MCVMSAVKVKVTEKKILLMRQWTKLLLAGKSNIVDNDDDDQQNKNKNDLRIRIFDVIAVSMELNSKMIASYCFGSFLQ